MKTVKINFVDFWDDFNPRNNKFYSILSKKFNVILDDNPEYIFYSVFGFKHLNYDCVKIFYTGEQVSADFDLCDYAIGFDYLVFEDRYFRYPYYLLTYTKEEILALNYKNLQTDQEIFNKGFASFIVSNKESISERIKFYKLLNSIKVVDSGGKVENNLGYNVIDKIDFISKYKFNIAFENSSYNGYTTEKIVDAFIAGTVPIYYGNPLIYKEFNPKAFVNVESNNDYLETLERIIEIDGDLELYKSILSEKIIKDDSLIPSDDDLSDFLYSIFIQEPNNAVRRPHSQRSITKNKYFKVLSIIESLYIRVPRLIKRLISKL
jgi:alpha(1,3/1,4) fucosyltransferase